MGKAPHEVARERSCKTSWRAQLVVTVELAGIYNDYPKYMFDYCNVSLFSLELECSKVTLRSNAR
jgi:hypothetical protein